MAHGASPRHSRRARPRPSKPDSADKAGAPRSEPVADRRETRSVGATKASARTAQSASPAESGSPVRLQKLLANAGFGSRREVERFILEERVTINGRVATLGESADPLQDDLRVDGERLAREKPVYWLVNKPRGVVTTVRDDSGRRTVIDLLPRRAGRVFPVGRLDRETSGLLLLTNDGDLAHALLHPSLGNEREYRVQVKGRVSEQTVSRLERGVPLEEGRTAPARVAGVRFDPETGTTTLGLTLVEGRKRQIRRSLLVLGHPVRRLVRVRMGPLQLGRLATGEARQLKPEERQRLFEHVERLRSGEGKERPRSTPQRRRAPTAGSARPPSGPRAEKNPAAGKGRSEKNGRKPATREAGQRNSAARSKRQRTPRSRKGTRK